MFNFRSERYGLPFDAQVALVVALLMNSCFFFFPGKVLPRAAILQVFTLCSLLKCRYFSVRDSSITGTDRLKNKYETDTLKKRWDRSIPNLPGS